MSMKDKNEEFHQKIYYVVWNQYKLLSESSDKYHTRYQMFLAFLGIIFLILFELRIYETHYLFFTPMIFLGISGFIALYYLIPRITYIPWIEKHQFEEMLKKDKKSFEIINEDIFKVIGHARAIQSYYKQGIRFIINLILMSIFSMPIIYFSLQSNPVFLGTSWSLFWTIIIFYNYKFDKEIKPLK